MMVRAGCSNTSFRPQFVTELQAPDLDMLKLPSELMKHVEDENKSRSFATVLSPIGKTWNIKLTRDHSETFFKGGWPEFSKLHKLEAGFKLVFRYEGNMVFNVKVFGLNGCLKDYNQDAVAILRSGFNASREKSPAKCASVTEDNTRKNIDKIYKMKQLQQRRQYLTGSQNFAQGDYKYTLLYSTDMKVKQMQMAMVFAIWKERCRRVFQEKERTPIQLTAEIIQEQQLWFNTNVALQYEE